jgi:hypothetical protein
VRPMLAPEPSPLGWLVQAILWGWTLLWAASYLWTTTGSTAERAASGTVCMAGMALAGVAGWLVVVLLWRLPPFRRLYAEPHPIAILDDKGLELHSPRVGVAHLAWDDIGALRPRRNHPAELLGIDGTVLAEVPGALISSGRPNLARAVVSIRPDRYALLRSRFGRVTGGFACRQ